MRATVTGAAGFAGRHLVAHLRACGDEVTTIDRHGPRPVDVTDAAAVRDAIGAHRPEVVYHLAAWSHVGASWDEPVAAFRVNAEGTLNVLRACATAGVDRVLVVGSAEEYGRAGEAPVDEDAPLRPLTPYGAGKVAADVLALQSFLGDGLATVRVRPFNHTGPGQSPRFLVPALARRIAEAERDGTGTVPVGNLEPVRDLSDVRDVVRAYRLAAMRGTPGDVYNVCSGRGVSVAEVAEHLLGAAHRPLRLVPDPELSRPVEVPCLVGDHRRLTEVTGWAPQIPLERTLTDVLAEARAALPER